MVVRRYITENQFDELINATSKSDWLCENEIVSTAEFCGYGFYGYEGCGIETSESGKKYYVEYEIGDSCD